MCGACDWFETHFDQSCDSLSVDREEVKVNSTELRAEWLGEGLARLACVETSGFSWGCLTWGANKQFVLTRDASKQIDSQQAE